MDNPLKDKVRERMERLGIKVPELSKQTNIPQSRIYKWFPKDPNAKKANPKFPDTETLEKWLLKTENGLEQVPRETNREDLGPSYREQLWLGKIIGNEPYVPFVPYQARAGYSSNYENIDK